MSADLTSVGLAQRGENNPQRQKSKFIVEPSRKLSECIKQKENRQKLN